MKESNDGKVPDDWDFFNKLSPNMNLKTLNRGQNKAKMGKHWKNMNDKQTEINVLITSKTLTILK